MQAAVMTHHKDGPRMMAAHEDNVPSRVNAMEDNVPHGRTMQESMMVDAGADAQAHACSGSRRRGSKRQNRRGGSKCESKLFHDYLLIGQNRERRMFFRSL